MLPVFSVPHTLMYQDMYFVPRYLATLFTNIAVFLDLDLAWKVQLITSAIKYKKFFFDNQGVFPHSAIVKISSYQNLTPFS